MDFLPEDIRNYSEAHTQPESTLLQDLNRETHLKVLMPRMLSGHLQGRLLSMISHMVRPERILEIGTYTGYSAICLAEGLTKNGRLHSIEVNEELETRILKYWEKAGLKDTCTLHIGKAEEVIPLLSDQFDLVFIDADKENYSKYFDLVFPKIKSGGYILADNVLWSGKVTESPEHFDKDTFGIDSFNKKIHNDPRVEHLLLPVRDGIMIARKL